MLNLSFLIRTSGLAMFATKTEKNWILPYTHKEDKLYQLGKRR